MHPPRSFPPFFDTRARRTSNPRRDTRRTTLMRMHRVEKFARFSPSANVLEICAYVFTYRAWHIEFAIPSLWEFFCAHVPIRLVSRSRRDEHRYSARSFISGGEIAIESPKFPSRKPRKRRSHTGMSRLCTFRPLGEEKFRTFDPMVIREGILQATDVVRNVTCRYWVVISMALCIVNSTVTTYHVYVASRACSISRAHDPTAYNAYGAYKNAYIGVDTLCGIRVCTARARAFTCARKTANERNGQRFRTTDCNRAQATHKRLEFYWQRFDSTNFIRT